MRIGRKLLLALCATSLCAGVAYAQGPTLGPGDDNVAYKTKSDDEYVRTDDNTNNPAQHIVYQTVGKKTTYWVAPSILMHPALDHNKAKHTTGLNSQWKWELDATTPLSPAPNEEFAFDGYTLGTDVARTSLVVEAKKEKEIILKVTEKGDCANSISSYFKIIATPKPTLVIDKAGTTLGALTSTEVAAYTGHTITVPPTNPLAKGLEYKTCNKADVEGQTLTLKIKSEEGNAPDALRKYAFSIMKVEHQHKTDGTWVTGAATELNSYPAADPANKKKQIATAGENFTVTFPAAIAFPAGVDYIDYVYYLSGSEGRDGVVSMISQRSDIVDLPLAPAPVWTSYDYDRANNLSYVKIRVMDTPKTGPVYFIPYID